MSAVTGFPLCNELFSSNSLTDVSSAAIDYYYCCQ